MIKIFDGVKLGLHLPLHQKKVLQGGGQVTEDQVLEMARRSYGFGSWDAPYWFIGPEQGQGKEENHELSRRAKAWLQLDVDGLCDCRKFHDLIEITEWHRDNPALQPTWRPLMLLLMTFLQQSTDKESLRVYQRDKWGILNGQTCVIELSGLPANNFKIQRQRELFRQERMDTIRQRMRAHKPALVFMFGKGQRKQWEQIAGDSFSDDEIDGYTAGIQKCGSSLIAFAPHPHYGPGNAYWIKFGEKLSKLSLDQLPPLN